uniref:Uncharacterized protein n=1 Tax=Chromera velia CCMP2878 TaxID=1169474 RepID=A0A0G4IF58_9ALVE|eukprot:Cvel_13924.t1-p1 / transcript=Cvel_13924.t1 / gene=Cvel_13924 / organism=Chromera_velia_CCMP2878 / gene_product=hypothetical protein / transcript_product=hypothetical protein / location=Cvel_scaffold971:10779-15843(+) / protein_length=574 / sequence_SO=supercontig / SO=protein_coding / is_pseudo=false
MKGPVLLLSVNVFVFLSRASRITLKMPPPLHSSLPVCVSLSFLPPFLRCGRCRWALLSPYGGGLVDGDCVDVTVKVASSGRAVISGLGFGKVYKQVQGVGQTETGNPQSRPLSREMGNLITGERWEAQADSGDGRREEEKPEEKGLEFSGVEQRIRAEVRISQEVELLWRDTEDKGEKEEEEKKGEEGGKANVFLKKGRRVEEKENWNRGAVPTNFGGMGGNFSSSSSSSSFSSSSSSASCSSSRKQRERERPFGDRSSLGSLLLLDWVAAGREASGERWAFEEFSSRIRVGIRKESGEGEGEGEKRRSDDVFRDFTLLTGHQQHQPGTNGPPPSSSSASSSPFSLFGLCLVLGPQLRAAACRLAAGVCERKAERVWPPPQAVVALNSQHHCWSPQQQQQQAGNTNRLAQGQYGHGGQSGQRTSGGFSFVPNRRRMGMWPEREVLLSCSAVRLQVCSEEEDEPDSSHGCFIRSLEKEKEKEQSVEAGAGSRQASPSGSGSSFVSVVSGVSLPSGVESYGSAEAAEQERIEEGLDGVVVRIASRSTERALEEVEGLLRDAGVFKILGGNPLSGVV